MPNELVIMQTMDEVAKDLKSWSQRHWAFGEGSAPDFCNTTFCVAGRRSLMSGWYPSRAVIAGQLHMTDRWSRNPNEIVNLGINNFHNRPDLKTPASIAREAMELTEHQARGMFYKSQYMTNFDDMRRMVDAILEDEFEKWEREQAPDEYQRDVSQFDEIFVMRV